MRFLVKSMASALSSSKCRVNDVVMLCSSLNSASRYCIPFGFRSDLCAKRFLSSSGSSNGAISDGDGTGGPLKLPKPVKINSYKYEGRNFNANLNPILIYHGLFGNRNNWRSLSKALAEKTSKIVIPMDVRNHGLSGHSDEMTYPAMVSDALELMSNKKIEQATLIGHSLGGRAFIQFALTVPEKVEKLIIVDVGMLKPAESNHNHIEYIVALREAAKSIPEKSSLMEARKVIDHKLKKIVIDPFIRGFLLLNLTESESGQITWQCNLEALEKSLKLGLIDTMTTEGTYNGPTLLIYGGKSGYVDDNQIAKLAQHFPNLKTHCIKDGNHYLHVEKASEFLQQTVEFINFS